MEGPVMARSLALGQLHEIDLPSATLRYRERGEGPPVVLVHGLLVNADLWRNVTPALSAGGFRCLAPDWPLGSHDVPVPRADLSPPGVANLVADFLDALDLHDVTVVANDTGGAIAQLLMVQRPRRIGRVVLTPSDSFERFFPPPFTFLPRLARIPGAVWLLVQSLRLRALHRLPIAFGWVTKRPIEPGVADSYLEPSRRVAAIRRDLARFLVGVHNRHTLAAARELPRFTKPVLLAWATEDRLFPMALARRLAATLPNATLVPIEDSYTFIPEDQPAQLARLIVEFSRVAVAA
jgi:pimeloyl-ACP methyl ester carboxylesterase